MSYQVLNGDCIDMMRTLPDKCVHTCITSPPYYGLRDYGHDGQIGLEQTPEAYVQKMVEVFREVRRVLRDDGTVWLNLGDSYCGYKGDNYGKTAGNLTARALVADNGPVTIGTPQNSGLKPKDLIGIPWRVAFALQADGWWLRQDIIWHKPNPMPESVTDRCTKAHEYIFLLAKSARYYFDADAIAETAIDPGVRISTTYGNAGTGKPSTTGYGENAKTTRNKRSVWTVTPKPYKGAHFATFPPDLIRPCVLAGCPVGGVVLDPFGGSGTTAQVAIEEGRSAILCELNPEYIPLIHARLSGVQMKLTDGPTDRNTSGA